MAGMVDPTGAAEQGVCEWLISAVTVLAWGSTREGTHPLPTVVVAYAEGELIQASASVSLVNSNTDRSIEL